MALGELISEDGRGKVEESYPIGTETGCGGDDGNRHTTGKRKEVEYEYEPCRFTDGRKRLVPIGRYAMN
jgi:hypothetical protein